MTKDQEKLIDLELRIFSLEQLLNKTVQAITVQQEILKAHQNIFELLEEDNK